MLLLNTKVLMPAAFMELQKANLEKKNLWSKLKTNFPKSKGMGQLAVALHPIPSQAVFMTNPCKAPGRGR